MITLNIPQYGPHKIQVSNGDSVFKTVAIVRPEHSDRCYDTLLWGGPLRDITSYLAVGYGGGVRIIP